MNDLVIMQDRQAVTTSLKVAEVFDKNHRDVMESIRNSTAENSAVEKMFEKSSYINLQKHEHPMYYMNRDGFSLLAMGFTGKKAMGFKLKYIAAFNKMEDFIKNGRRKDNYPIPATYGEALQLAADLQKKVEHDKPKVDYYDSQMRNPGLMTTTVIANDYDMSAREMHQKLHDYGVIYRQGKNWVLYSKYKGQGYAQEEPFPYRNSNNHQGMKPILKWTQKGKKLIYDLFKQHGILPSVEQMELLPG